ncbi:hypothetical protein J5N97_013198 [Dioscorea zingiberensis]|uniref:Uncharacterized protein n=1 Tax=Dioscorea zingiberensis TaxID=325984 RepID=A0A9D5CRE8_9LILI|nr:hypothetical protein J5N97_013198 [Dioscorea zingiberensis]
MGRSIAISPLKMAFAFAVSYSLSVSFSSSKSPSSSSPSHSLASDLLAILGAPRDAARVDSREAKEIRSCLRFLVPVTPLAACSSGRIELGSGRRLSGSLRDYVGADPAEADRMVWWPPAPVMELARLAVDSGGDPAQIHRALDPTVLPVPDVEHVKEDKCELTRTPYGRRFINKELNSYFAFLFELIAARAPLVGFNVSLSRYDLFHGHMFLATDSGRLGILFHAKEYPAYEKKDFPYNLGYCQRGSNVAYDNSINLRNILWLAPLPSKVTKAWEAPGVLVILDAHPDGIIYKNLVPGYVDLVRTIYEDTFGDHVVDVNYLNLENVYDVLMDFAVLCCLLFSVRVVMAKKAIDNLVFIHVPAFVTIVVVVIYILLNRRRENIEDYDDMDDTLSENEMQPQYPLHDTNNIPSPRRSPTPETSSDPIMAELSNGIAKITSAIKDARKSWKDNLFEVVLAMEGYDEYDLDMACDVLSRDEIKGRAFTHKKPSMRKRWMDKFLASEE